MPNPTKLPSHQPIIPRTPDPTDFSSQFIEVFFLVTLIGPACADDKADLQRLHLSQTEQQYYNQLANSDERHQFIITTQYLQYLRDIRPSIMYEDLGQIDGKKLREMRRASY